MSILYISKISSRILLRRNCGWATRHWNLNCSTGNCLPSFVVIARLQRKAESIRSLRLPVILPKILGYADGSCYRGQPVRDGRPAYILRVTAWNVHFIYRVCIVSPQSILSRKVLERMSRRFSSRTTRLQFNPRFFLIQNLILYCSSVLIQLNLNVLALSVEVVVIHPLLRYRN